MRARFTAFAAVIALATSAIAHGADEPPLSYQGALGTLGAPDKGRTGGTGQATGLELIYGIPRADSAWGYELNAFGAILETGNDSGTDYYRWGLGGDVRYNLAPRWHVVPFALAGLNLAYNDVQPNVLDSVSWGANLGFGAVSQRIFADRFRLRGEVRATYDDYESGFVDYLVGFGVEFALARPAVMPPPTVIERIEVVPAAACTMADPSMPADSHGCKIDEVTRLDGVTFEFDQARLRPDAITILADVADTLRRNPTLEVEIGGHTDNLGSDEYNLELSQRRADAVRQALVDKGIDGARITAVGYGETQPVASNETEDGREYNRRVEMRIKNMPGQPGTTR